MCRTIQGALPIRPIMKLLRRLIPNLYERGVITIFNSLLQRSIATPLSCAHSFLSTYSEQRVSDSGFTFSSQQLELVGVESSDLTHRTSRVCRSIEQDSIMIIEK